MCTITLAQFNAHQNKYFKLSKREPVVVTRDNGDEFIIQHATPQPRLTRERMAHELTQAFHDVKAYINGQSVGAESFRNAYDLIDAELLSKK